MIDPTSEEIDAFRKAIQPKIDDFIEAARETWWESEDLAPAEAIEFRKAMYEVLDEFLDETHAPARELEKFKVEARLAIDKIVVGVGGSPAAIS